MGAVGALLAPLHLREVETVGGITWRVRPLSPAEAVEQGVMASRLNGFVGAVETPADLARREQEAALQLAEARTHQLRLLGELAAAIRAKDQTAPDDPEEAVQQARIAELQRDLEKTLRLATRAQVMLRPRRQLLPGQARQGVEQQLAVLCQCVTAAKAPGEDWEKVRLVMTPEEADTPNNIVWVGSLRASLQPLIAAAWSSAEEASVRLQPFPGAVRSPRAGAARPDGATLPPAAE